MDHAGDIAWKLARAYKMADPEHAHITEPRGDRIEQTLIVTEKGSYFRVTVREVDYSDLTEEEDYRAMMTTDPMQGYA